MRLEEGIDKDGEQCWFVLDGADLVGIYYTLLEAQTAVNNG